MTNVRDEKKALSASKPLDTTVPQDENLPTCAPSGLEPPTYHILGRQHCSVHHGLNNSATKAGTGLQICQVELRFSSCVCVYSQEKMCPVYLYHRVYLVDRNFLGENYIFSCLPGTIRHSLILQSK